MAVEKAERLLNLVIALVTCERFQTADWVHRQVAGYAADADAFNRTFERDKSELRDLGIPLVTDEYGRYRILPEEFGIAEMHFTAAEWAAVMLATRLWSTTSLASAQAAARRKLADANAEPGQVAAPDLLPLVHTREAAFEPLLAAILARRQVSFDYRKPEADQGQQRRVQPWKLGQTRGRWYLIGFDTDRLARRTFRLSRIAGKVQIMGPAGAYAIPEDVDTAAILRESADPGQSGRATIVVQPGHGDALRRITTSACGDRLSIDYTDAAYLARAVAALGPHACVLEPESLKLAVIGLLRGVIGTAGEDQ